MEELPRWKKSAIAAARIGVAAVSLGMVYVGYRLEEAGMSSNFNLTDVDVGAGFVMTVAAVVGAESLGLNLLGGTVDRLNNWRDTRFGASAVAGSKPELPEDAVA